MRHTKRTVTALVLCLVIVVTSASVALFVDAPPGQGSEQRPGLLVFYSLVYFALGALLVWQRPSQFIPWLLVAMGVILALSAPGAQVEQLGSTVLQRTGVAIYVTFGMLFALLVQLFPTGRPIEGPWRWVTRLLVAGTAGLTAGYLLGVDNPRATVLLSLLASATFFAYAVGMVGSIPVLLVRFRRSEDAERAQLKWYTFSIILTVVLWFQPLPALTALAPLLMPVALVVALLRYHLYDIDRVISRTASYAIVTGLVLALYFGAVAVTSLLPKQWPTLSVAAATLAAAAVFRPALRWIQRRVDHRFNRMTYDSARTVEAFGAGLRTQVNANQIEANLLTAIQQTLHPTQTTLWLKAQR
ncbi:MAG: hypothetical protein WAN48_00265 [Actinomycetes bacterium]